MANNERVTNNQLTDLVSRIVIQFEKMIVSNANRIINFQTNNYSTLSNQIASIQKRIQVLANKNCCLCACSQYQPEKVFHRAQTQEYKQTLKSSNMSYPSNRNQGQYFEYRMHSTTQSQSLSKQYHQKLAKESAQSEQKLQKLKKQQGKMMSKMIKIRNLSSRLTQLNNSKILTPSTTENQFKVLQKQFQQIKFFPTYSQLLWTYPNENKLTNFHKKFDERKNILLIVSLKNGNIITAFSSLQFQKYLYPTDFKNSQFFIGNLTKNIFIVPQEEENKGIKYEEFHIIFGNNQLMIKNKSNKLKVNFNEKGYYSYPKNVPIVQFQNQFLGENINGEAQIQSYEIFQLFYQQGFVKKKKIEKQIQIKKQGQ